MIEINNTELKFYWNNHQHLPTNTAKKLIKRLVWQQCKLLSKVYYDNNNKLMECSSSDGDCWSCDIDANYMGIGRQPDLCGAQENKMSTSFVDQTGYNNLCSHLVITDIDEM